VIGLAVEFRYYIDAASTESGGFTTVSNSFISSADRDEDSNESEDIRVENDQLKQQMEQLIATHAAEMVRLQESISLISHHGRKIFDNIFALENKRYKLI
jgi:hypothetical protein